MRWGCQIGLAGLSVVVTSCSVSEAPPTGDKATTPTAATAGEGPRSGATGAPTGEPAGSPRASDDAAWGAAKCAATGTRGFSVGQTLGALDVKDCDTGADASLDEVCGAAATWIFAAHTHCPTCQATAKFTDDLARSVASANVAVVQLVHDDNGTSCAKWRDAYKLAGIPNVRVYADPNAEAWGVLRSKNATAASVFLDANRVITFKAHSLTEDEIRWRIDEARATK